MGFILVCILVIVLLGVAIVQFGLLFAGNRELINGVDSGTLNTGKMASTVTVDIQSGGVESQFSDVAENGNSFSLKSINRMWGKCLLCMLNQQEMQNDGYDSGNSNQDAEFLYTAANSISSRLSAKLSDQTNLAPFFTQLVSRESERALGSQAAIVNDPGLNWQTSLMDRNIESNVAVYAEQLPASDLSGVNSVKASNSLSYFSGYNPIKVLDQYITFVPFRYQTQPHMVSSQDFTANMNSTSPISNCSTPIPNAFSCQGKTVGQVQGVQHAKSYTISNPQTTYDLSIPHSFIHINLGTNTCHFWCDAAPYPIYDQTYGYAPPSPFFAQSGPMDGTAGVCTATVTPLGLEFLPYSIWGALTPLSTYGGDYSTLKKVLTQRCAEMKHGFQESDLESVLGSIMLPGITDYYIYPDSSGNVTVAPSFSNPVPPSWVLSGGPADGSQQEICSNGDTTFGAGLPIPPFVVEVEFEGIGGGSGVYLECDSVKWTAGTGYNGDLGDVTVTHDSYAQCITAGLF